MNPPKQFLHLPRLACRQTGGENDGDYLLAPADSTRCVASSSAWLVWTSFCFKPYAVLAQLARLN